MSQIYKYWPGNIFMTYYMNNHIEDWHVLHNPILLKTEFYRGVYVKLWNIDIGKNWGKYHTVHITFLWRADFKG